MTESIKNLKLLTYNVFLRPPPINTNGDDYKNERLNDIIDRIDNYDIVCFQEMFQTATFRKEKVIEAAIQKGFYYWKDCHPPPFWNGPPVDSGLLVLSKYPIEYSQFQSYQVGVLSDSASDKGYIYCKINVEGKILHLFTTHFQASYLLPGKLYQRELSIKTRIHQFKKLLQRMYKILPEHTSKPSEQLILFCGDLNMNAHMIPIDVHGQKSVLSKDAIGQKFNEYDTFMKIFTDFGIKATNCGYQSNDNKHPITFGNGDDILTNSLESYSKQCLDFIYYLQIPITPINPYKQIGNGDSKQTLNTEPQTPCLRPIVNSTKIQQFNIKDRPYRQLSDHFGMSIELKIIS